MIDNLPSSAMCAEVLNPRPPHAAFSGERGSVLFYIFLAMGLLAALTYSFVKDSRQNLTAQVGSKVAEELNIQVNVIRSAIMECTIEYPEGGDGTDPNHNIDLDGDAGTTDNENNPFPVNPDYAHNPHGVAANNNVRNLSCTGAPSNRANIFQGTQNKGRFLPPPPSGFSEWKYINDSDGVRIEIDGSAGGASAENALQRLASKFDACHADRTTCSTGCFTVWIDRTLACP